MSVVGRFAHIRPRGWQHTKKSYITSAALPDRVNVVVVGGGIIGTSVCYHLAKLGVENVLLLERNQLTSGTTWHAAGLMNTFGSKSSTSTWMRQYTKELYQNILPHETGQETGYMEIGFIELAADHNRLEAYRRTAAFNRYVGVDVTEIAAEEVQERFPLCRVDDVLAGFLVPTDGRANPTDTTLALAKGARQYGARIVEGISVQGVTTQPNIVGPATVTGVVLGTGETIEATVVVNCTGMWARQFAEACGVYNVPNQAAEHYYLITEAIPEVSLDWPVIEDASRCVYIRPEGQGLMLGLFESEGACWSARNVPEKFAFGEIEPDWDRMIPYVEAAMERVPIVKNVGIKKLFCGPESFTPDNNPIVGETPELRNYFVAAGLNSIGILTGGGIGHVLAHWIRDGHCPHTLDVTAINANRFHRFHSTPTYRRLRTGEALGNTYKVHFPDHQMKTCRNVKQSSLHERLVAQGAYFRDVSGWESPAWYAVPDQSPHVECEVFGRESWFPQWAAEHHACRNQVALFDMSFMSKFLVKGREAGSFLNWLSTANVDGECGRVKYTQWLNEQGTMEADLTVTKLKDDEFLVVATDTMHNHVYDHMMRRMCAHEDISVIDVTARYAQINLQGPSSRALLERLTYIPTDFYFGQARELDIGLAPRVLCLRITYVGELGYELFVPVEQARHVYDCIVEEGRVFHLAHAGLRALGSLRLEKGYRDYGHDMDNTDTLLECGLGFTCDFRKVKAFIGQKHVLAQKAQLKTEDGGHNRRMVHVLLDDPEPLLHHGEIVWRNGERISDVRAASYGHTLGGAVGLTMLESKSELIKQSFLRDGTWEIEVGNKRYPCTVSLAPFYDPKNLRIKV